MTDATAVPLPHRPVRRARVGTPRPRARSSPRASRASTRTTPSCTRSSTSIATTRCALPRPPTSSAAPACVRGPLHGLPIALKDLLHWKGRVTTAGSKSWRGRVSERHGDRARAADRGGHDPARQDAHGRVRVRRMGTQPADGRAVESVGPRGAPRRRRLVERIRGRGGRRPRTRRDRLGHRRLGAHSRGAVRPDRPQDHVRAHQPARGRCRCRRRSTRSGRSRTPSTIARC